MKWRWIGVAAVMAALAIGATMRSVLLRSRTNPPRFSTPREPTPSATAEPSAIRAKPTRARWKLSRLAVIGFGLAFAGFMVAASGVVPLKASVGHWAITRWFLQFSKSRSIATHSLAVDVPKLSDPSLVMKGAGHYEIGCAPCHGSPLRPPPRVVQHMLPPPPPLDDLRARWSDAELFYIIKHGLKFTGMPAWPAPERDDEVWSVVALLRELPRLDAPSYGELALGENLLSPTSAGLRQSSEIPDAVVQNCARCHGVDGLGRRTSAFPRLAGQTAEYLEASLEAYARGTRQSGIMGPIAASLSAASLREVALHYAQRPLLTTEAADDRNPASEAILRGREIAERGLPHRRVPPCIECHGPREGPRNAHYPRLVGQHADYLVPQLELFRQGRRGGTRYAPLMQFVASHLTPGQMRDVAAFYEVLHDKHESLDAAP